MPEACRQFGRVNQSQSSVVVRIRISLSPKCVVCAYARRSKLVSFSLLLSVPLRASVSLLACHIPLYVLCRHFFHQPHDRTFKVIFVICSLLNVCKLLSLTIITCALPIKAPIAAISRSGRKRTASHHPHRLVAWLLCCSTWYSLLGYLSLCIAL